MAGRWLRVCLWELDGLARAVRAIESTHTQKSNDGYAGRVSEDKGKRSSRSSLTQCARRVEACKLLRVSLGQRLYHSLYRCDTALYSVMAQKDTSSQNRRSSAVLCLLHAPTSFSSPKQIFDISFSATRARIGVWIPLGHALREAARA